MSKIIIQLQGGLVQEVFITGKGTPTKAIIVDEDTEGVDRDETTYYTTEDGNSAEACIHTEDIAKLRPGCDMDNAVKTYLKGI
jgi:hypothetical protein